MTPPPRPFGVIAALCGGLWLSACGGGGGDSSAPPPPPPPPPPPAATALPDLDIVAPATGDLGAAVTLSTSATPAAALKAQWDFGDGTTATDLAPQHQFARAGDLTVKLTLTNEAGTQKTYSKAISLTNKVLVKGNTCSAENDQGWCWMPPQASGNVIHAVRFVDANTGWRVGELGDILKTTDAGRTWTRQNSGIRTAIDSVFARSATDIVARSAEAHVLLLSQDGGTSWTRVPVPVDGGNVIPLGGGKTLIVPANSSDEVGVRYLASPSASWQQLAFPAYGAFASAGPDGSLAGYGSVADDFSTLGFAYAPSPLAPAKIALPLPPIDGGSALVMYRTAPETVWVSRVPTYYTSRSTPLYLYRSTDNGAHWGEVVPAWDAAALQYFAANDSSVPLPLISDATGARVLMQPTRLRPLDGRDPTAFIPIGLWSSADGGVHWKQRLMVADGDRLSCATWLEQATCESNSQLVTTSDFGESLKPISKGVAYDSSTTRLAPAGAALTLTQAGQTHLVSFDGSRWQPMYAVLQPPGSTTRAAMSSTAPSFGSRQVARRVFNRSLWASSDSGRTWMDLGRLVTTDGKEALSVTEQAGTELSGVEMLNEQRLIVVGADGRAAVSRDAGATWQRPAELNRSGLAIQQVQAQDAQLAWARGLEGTRTRLLVTRDGGATWRNIGFLPSTDVLSLRFGTGQELNLVDSKGQAFQSSDDGASWSKSGSANTALNHVFAQGDKSYWAVGNAGVLMKSTDNGVSWQALNRPTTANLTASCFVDDKRGWAGAQGGEMWITTDGGTTWRQQTLPARQDVTALTCQDGRTVWAAGNDGLLATGTGGD